jgi:hypothetical protein
MRYPPFLVVIIAGAALAGCSGSAQQPEFSKRPAGESTQASHDQPATIRDQSRLLPPKGLKHSGIVMDHVAGLPKLPGGTVGDYSVSGKTYQVFIIDAGTNQQAAFLLLDAKGVLKDPEYLSSYGGYFGLEASRPVFVFSKERYLAGIVGLPKDEADPVARTLASRLK